jgi:cellulose biosynthesis protein BcsQ
MNAVMDMSRKNQCRYVAFVGVRRGVGTTTLTVNTAAILGVVARRKTLLLDVSGNESGVGDHLGVSDDCGLLGLTTPFLRAGQISAEELAEHVVRYEPGEPWQPGVSTLDVLPGFNRGELSPAEADRLRSYRGVHLVNAVCRAARLAGYEFVVSDNGAWGDIPKSAMLLNSERAVVVTTSRESDVSRIRLPLNRLEGIGRSALVVFNGISRTKLYLAYGDARLKHEREPILKNLPHEATPPISETYLAECVERGKPAALHMLERVQSRPDKFASALVAVAGNVDPQVSERLLDSQGRPLRMGILRSLVDLLVD